MSFKIISAICAFALLKTISAQYLGPCNNYVDGFGLAGPYDGTFAGPYAGIYDGPYAAFDGPYGYPGAYDTAYAGPYAGPYDNAYGIPFGSGYGPASLAASNGGGLAVTSSSPIAPTGVTMISENAYDGALAVSGAMPFLGAVALEGALPTVGSGAVTYGCGNGNVAMTSEDYPGPGYNAFAYDGYGPAYDRFAFNGLAGSLGCAGPYAIA